MSRGGACTVQSPLLECVGTRIGGQPAAMAATKLSPAHLATEARGFCAGASGLGSSRAGGLGGSAGEGEDTGMGFRSTGGAGGGGGRQREMATSTSATDKAARMRAATATRGGRDSIDLSRLWLDGGW